MTLRTAISFVEDGDVGLEGALDGEGINFSNFDGRNGRAIANQLARHLTSRRIQ